jgi:hypothetical protein
MLTQLLLTIFFLLNVQWVSSSLALNATSRKAWPGPNKVESVDKKDTWGINFSGLYYISNGDINRDIMYGIMNKPPLMFKLRWDGDHSNWVNTEGAPFSLSAGF